MFATSFNSFQTGMYCKGKDPLMKEVTDAMARLTVTENTRPLPTEDSGVVAITAAMARLMISPLPSKVLKEGKFHFPSRPTESPIPMVIDGEPTRVRRTLVKDARLWWDNALQSASVGKTLEAKEKDARCMESLGATCSMVIEGESVRIQQILRIAPETQVKETCSQKSTCIPTQSSSSVQPQSTRVNQTLTEDARVWWNTAMLHRKKPEFQKRPSHKRKREADDPAEGRSADRPAKQRTRRKVDGSGDHTNKDDASLVSTPQQRSGARRRDSFQIILR
ncbi:uncharacterized protein LOC121891109 [Thunnus maccoyii]|uniref:uncharacterized protein LOC121891109 n=1 Tax=Thunnus maccoyii TaxID=8240 RepID=UPI001C4B1903|nr:uncharacterized protein LOC121891109 [Thunnus maccoyii]